MEDTIAAISTPIGRGGIGIVRMSGKNAIAIADRIFVAKGKKRITEFINFSVHLGNVICPSEEGEGSPNECKGDIIDEALLTVMRAPRSYTAEDIIEINCHGGGASLRAVLSLIVDCGARLATPGEFTKRAFLNGRIDLVQAEAVLDIIQSRTDAFLRVSTHQLKGELSSELDDIREELMSVYTQMEAIVNFPEEGIDVSQREDIVSNINLAKEKVEKLLLSSDQGRILKEGIKIVICGRPNVGKSSLLNILLKQPRAIVSDIAGTTRDTIEESAQIDGIPFQLIDTAGILTPRDIIEKEAVKRSHMHIQGANLVLLIFDASEEIPEKDDSLIESLEGQEIIVLINKCDLECKIDKPMVAEKFKGREIIEISALKKIGIDILHAAIMKSILHGNKIDTHAVLVSNVRHINSLTKCREALSESIKIFDDGLSLEFISEEIKIAVDHLDQITGRNIDADLLDGIFSQFCVGK